MEMLLWSCIKRILCDKDLVYFCGCPFDSQTLFSIFARYIYCNVLLFRTVYKIKNMFYSWLD